MNKRNKTHFAFIGRANETFDLDITNCDFKKIL